ncbi:MAG: response regulator [bacterium]|nr:response regulator [bacterium]
MAPQAESIVALAIPDIKLKKRTDLEVLAEIKNIAPATRVIMLTAYPTVATTQASFRLGASEYCVKPIDNDVLEETVDRVSRAMAFKHQGIDLFFSI